jgi:hypothetical protein
MSRCCSWGNHCITVSGTTNEDVWLEITAFLGPGSPLSEDLSWEELRDDYIEEYVTWTASNGAVPFDKWLIWRYEIGTAEYGNLSKNKINEGKVGRSWMPCPYSTESDDLRTRLSLKLSDTDPLPPKITHKIGGNTYYMTINSKGPRWGFECTYIGCPYYILTGKRYFYV